MGVLPEEHTMGNSLERYLSLKIHPWLVEPKVDKVHVRGLFDRTHGVASNEKTDKLFNYMRPTVEFRGSSAYLNCFPGADYVYHYACILSSYYRIKSKSIKVDYECPDAKLCDEEIERSSLSEIPRSKIVVMGYVEGLDLLSEEPNWSGEGSFQWKKTTGGRALLVGCKHSYWGDISASVVRFLAKRGIELFIYSGKLGTLDANLRPNETIATGDSSILPDGRTVSWTNVFAQSSFPEMEKGIHVTMPSVLCETKQWRDSLSSEVKFVDPEIGRMALAAEECGIGFSYLHVVSDNLSAKYSHDLSNEREDAVLDNRAHLMRAITTELSRII